MSAHRGRRVAVGERAAHVVAASAWWSPMLRPTTIARASSRVRRIGFAARHLADAGVAVGVGEDHQVSGEERPVRAAEVQQHAVVAGDRDHASCRGRLGCGAHRSYAPVLSASCANHLVAVGQLAAPPETPCPPWCAARRRSRARAAASAVDRHRCADGVLRGLAVAQRDGETPQPRRVLLVVGRVAAHPHLVEGLVESAAVDDRVGGQRT